MENLSRKGIDNVKEDRLDDFQTSRAGHATGKDIFRNCPMAVDTAASSAAEEVLGRKSRLFVRDRTTGCKFLVDSGADVSIFPVSKEKEHQDHIKLVFDRFQQYGLRINVAKSVMGADQVEYMGYFIIAEGSYPLPEKVEAINNYKMPDIIHELRTFLGKINF
ncbi:retrovirus-related Pol polyprotein from transposon opus [Nephila pilipes]|uniref:Retrovirus-related Pol polyprotein from transposon opus n=1 Tax=Nephila pilipes TaxID=299642 RepID=A0A8X6PAS7_NEPPI|nr:retrovirus-related Pol polyprotein from transposon opus [Nephila pilipes]